MLFGKDFTLFGKKGAGGLVKKKSALCLLSLRKKVNFYVTVILLILN